MKYRAEIDGLRALAVVPVILFHAGFDLFSGGYVGVDVFFVISGYLITTILIEDIENKRLSIIKFYERRARRILPALFFVMIVCIPFAWIWMLPSQMKDFSQSIVAVSLFTSNILFWRQSGYFDDAAEEKPLLHTWSLAVEEQYYVLFPVFLILVWRFGKNRVFWMIVVMATISLLLSEWAWRNKLTTTANFYLAPTRAWELFAGSITAFIVQKQGVKKSNSLALIGLSLIVFSIFFYDETTPFPSVYALVPVTGVVLLVLFANKETIVAKLLSTKVFVGIGLISYSSYLWHQPLFAFARIRMIDYPSLELMFFFSILSVLLGYCSWCFVEKPFRNIELTSRKMVFGFSIIGIGAFTVFGLILPKLSENMLYGSKVVIQNEISELSNRYVWARKSELRNSNFVSGLQKILVIGDSNSGDLINALDFITDNESVSLSSLTINVGCGAVYVSPDRFQQFIETSRTQTCRNADTLHSVHSKDLMHKADVVIFASSWKDWEVSFLDETRDKLIGEFGDKFWWFGNKHVEFPSERERLRINGDILEFYPVRNEKQLTNDLMQEILGERFINPYNLICEDASCRVINSQGILLTYDGFHLTREGAEYFAKKLLTLTPQIIASWLDNK